MVGDTSGRQPLRCENASVLAIVNGEFYDHQSVRQLLESRGHRFCTNSDSEILVHLYEDQGIDCFSQLRGEFALVLWDEKRSRLIAVRDRFGVKPLVYSLQNEGVLFASEAKALLPELTGGAIDWDHEAFYYASSRQYLPTDRTLFKNIQQLQPGHIAVFDESGLQIQKYWDFDFPLTSKGHSQGHRAGGQFPDAVAETRRMLCESIRLRMDCEVPFCFHLSGGIDSSAVLGIASELSPNSLTAFTLSFEDTRYDEFSLAEETAAFCNARLQKITVSQQDLINHLEYATQAAEGLAINGHLSAKYLLNRAIHQCGYKAVLTGEGADEVFAGYAHLGIDYAKQIAAEASLYTLLQGNSLQVGMMLPHGPGLDTAYLRHTLGYVPTFMEAKAGLGRRLHSLLNDDWIRSWQGNHGYEDLAVASVMGQLEGRSRLHQSTWLWSKLALAGYIFKTLGDGTEMPHSVEGRVPYLDHVLFQYLRDVPTDWLIRGNVSKYLLREAVKPFVTTSTYQRQKHPLDAPPLYAASDLGRNTVRDHLSCDGFRKQPFYERRKIESLLASLPTMSPLDQQAWDPVLVMFMSTLAIQNLLTACAGESVK